MKEPHYVCFRDVGSEQTFCLGHDKWTKIVRGGKIRWDEIIVFPKKTAYQQVARLKKVYPQRKNCFFAAPL